MELRARGSCGPLLRQWRTLRKMSQLDVAVEAGVSARHVSFLETGRAQPSREMLILLAGVLDVPLRERNSLLRAAGFADLYRVTDLDAPEMAAARRALEFVLSRLEPYGAFVLDRSWNVLLANRAAMALAASVLPEPKLPINLMRVLFTSGRPLVENWDEVAAAMVQRLHREALIAEPDGPEQRLLAELLAQPDVPRDWRKLDLTSGTSPTLSLRIRRGEVRLNLFSMITTFGTPIDVTLQELRIETFFPGDEATDAMLRALEAKL